MTRPATLCDGFGDAVVAGAIAWAGRAGVSVAGAVGNLGVASAPCGAGGAGCPVNQEVPCPGLLVILQLLPPQNHAASYRDAIQGAWERGANQENPAEPGLARLSPHVWTHGECRNGPHVPARQCPQAATPAGAVPTTPHYQPTGLGLGLVVSELRG
jgi:hypothetical protein